jgi:hypothetical protein
MWFFTGKTVHRSQSMNTLAVNNETVTQPSNNGRLMTSSTTDVDHKYQQEINRKQIRQERKPRSASMFYQSSNRFSLNPKKLDHHAQFAQSLEHEFSNGKV